MDTQVVLAILGAAALHASWNAIAKGRSGSDPLAGAVLIAVGCGAVAMPVLAVAGLPARASLAAVIASGIIHVAYFLLVGLSYRLADLSAVYPLMRGGAPLITTLLGAALIGETLGAGMLGGVVLLSAGVVGLGYHALRNGGLDRRGLAVAVLNIGVIVAYTLTDGIGTRQSGNTAGYLAATMLLTAVLLVGLIAATRGALIGGAGVAGDLVARWPMALLSGAMAMASYGIALWAMTRAPIGAVAALRETSVLFGAALGAVVLGERFGPARWIAAVAIVAGLMLIKAG